MYYSLFEIFSIGVGPSSSHTVGPMRAAKRYLDNIRSAGKFEAVSRIDVTLYGSLALTGVGHGTVKAVVYGLMGLEAEAIGAGAGHTVRFGCQCHFQKRYFFAGTFQRNEVYGL